MSRKFYISSGFYSGSGTIMHKKIHVGIIREEEIITLATWQCNRRGESLTDVAGIKMICLNPDADGDCLDWKQSRDWLPGEELETSLKELQSDGDLYRIFDVDTEKEAFLAIATEFGMDVKAYELIHSIAKTKE
ncbi:MAG: hypothetical protein ORN54_00330 [Cyclobacteriaceae bacterium]|nr:hypothetical protein [Cyclobacteriaceae bacterium]